MDNPVGTTPALSQASRKTKKPVWVWILAVFACLCLCLAIPIIAVIRDPSWLNLLDTGAAKVKIEAGTYNGTLYTAPKGNFSCDFNLIMQDGFGPVLYASENVEKKMGTAFALNDFGMQYGVDYFQINSGSDLEKALADPNTRRQNLEAILNQTLLSNRGAKAAITHQEFLQDDILFAVIYTPEGSNIISEQNGITTRLDYQEGYYIFAAREWIYFVYSYITPTNIAEPLSPSDMQTRVDEFYRGCQFQP